MEIASRLGYCKKLHKKPINGNGRRDVTSPDLNTCDKSTIGRLEGWLNDQEHSLCFQGNRVPFLASTWWLIIVCNANSRRSDASSWSHLEYTGETLVQIKYFFKKKIF